MTCVENLVLEDSEGGVTDDLKGLAHLLVVNNKRRSKADGVTVGGLGQEAAVLHLVAKSGCVLAISGVNHNSVEETLTTDGRDNVVTNVLLEVAKLLTEDLTVLLTAVSKVLVNDDLESSLSNTAREWGSGVGGSVLTGLDEGHDLVVSKDSGHGDGTTTESLTEDDHIGADVLVVTGKHLTGTCKTSLDLIGDHENVVLLGNLTDSLEVSFIGHDDTSLALDVFEVVGSDVGVRLELFLESVEVVVRDKLEAGHEGAELSVGCWVRAGGDGRHGAAPEVVLRKENDGLVVRDGLLAGVGPASGELHSGFTSLHTRVGRENAVIAEELGDVLLILTELVIVEGAGSQGELGGLILECLDDSGVAVTLVHRRVSGKEVHVLLAFDVPDLDTTTLGEGHGERGVVVAAILVLKVDKLLAGELSLSGVSAESSLGGLAGNVSCGLVEHHLVLLFLLLLLLSLLLQNLFVRVFGICFLERDLSCALRI